MILGESGKMNPLRLVEFLDEVGTVYRIATTRWDLEATEVAEIYKNRWIIIQTFGLSSLSKPL